MAKPGTDISRQAFVRLLNAPQLAAIVRHLPSETLHRIIQRAGIEACEEIVMAALEVLAMIDVAVWTAVRQPVACSPQTAARYGSLDAMYARMYTMSSFVSFSATAFMSGAKTPFLVPF